MSNSARRLAIFVPDMSDGGAERSMLKLAKGISDRGYAVDLVLANATGPFMAEVPESLRLVNLNSRRVLTSFPALVRYLRRERPEAMLSVLRANIIAILARSFARVSTRVVVSERNTLSQQVRYYASDLRMQLTPRLVKRFYPWADGIVAVSKGVADDLAQVAGIPRDHIKVIYNPIVTPELQAKAQASLEHPWFSHGAPPVILAIGRLTAQKDYPTLIQAFTRVRRVLPARLLILGEGGERPALEALIRQLGIEQDVSMPGFILNPYPFMAKAAIFVLSSRWEGLPGVLIEALYCGAPLIATDCPSGPREILADGKYGLLVPVGDPLSLANAIEVALTGIRNNPPEESWHPYRLETVVNQYIDVLMGF